MEKEILFEETHDEFPAIFRAIEVPNRHHLSHFDRPFHRRALGPVVRARREWRSRTDECKTNFHHGQPLPTPLFFCAALAHPDSICVN